MRHDDPAEAAASPATDLPREATGTGPAAGRALCLSGGGYRAMLFHTGALWRLHELGQLSGLQRISSVSGGSIVAARLALRWNAVIADRTPATLVSEVVEPVRSLAGTTIDIPAVLLGALLPGSVSDRIAGYYRRHLYGDATLQAMPSDAEGPRFVLNASNVQSGVLWRFMRPYMRDYRVGEIGAPELSLATAVAASSAFPPVLSPTVLDLDPAAFTPDTGDGLQHEPYTRRAVLTDGGVYDNLGLETAWKRYRTILVSDAGGRMAFEPRPRRDWLRHTRRVLDVIDNQVRALRKRQVIAAYLLPRSEEGTAWRDGTYWGIWSEIANYRVRRRLPCPPDQVLALASVSTRLAKIPTLVQDRLLNWGYAICDAALRRWVTPAGEPPSAFPYPRAGIGPS